MLVEFIEHSNACTTREELVECFSKAIQRLGFDKFVYSLMRGNLSDNRKTFHGIVQSYPEAWGKHYAANDYINSDPTYRRALCQKGIFTWAQLYKEIPLSRQEKQVMNEAHDAGLHSGVSLSIHGPYGEAIGFGFASVHKQENPSKNQLCILYAMANQFHMVMSDLEEKTISAPNIKLSDKQREVLQWAAMGKSRSVIADIIKISEDTVDDHFRHIFRKLECNDRTLAVLKAMHLGLVRI